MTKRIPSTFLVLTVAVGIASAARLKYDTVEVTLISRQRRFKIRAEVADTRAKASLGLMHRSQLAPDAGMLFVFPDEAVRSFWMKNTLIPLDIIFVSEDFEIRRIVRNALPCEHSPCPRYSSVYPVKYVVEINSGLSEEIGLEHGDRIEVNFRPLTLKSLSSPDGSL
jgi:hypothetical protein